MGNVALRCVAKMNRNKMHLPLAPHQPVLYIECCPVNIAYRQHAHDLHRRLSDALSTLKADLQLQLRVNEVRTPRHGAFEVYIAPKPTDDLRSRHMLWTGISRVPAAAKVPHVDDIIAPACQVLKLRHRATGASQQNMVVHSDRHIQRIMQRRSGE